MYLAAAREGAAVKDPIRIVEAAYSSDTTCEQAWLERVAEAVLQNLPDGCAAIAYGYEIQRRDAVPWIAPRATAEINAPPGLAAAFLNQGPQHPLIQKATLTYHRTTGMQSGLAFMDSIPQFAQVGQNQFYREALRFNGWEDIVTLTAADPTPFGCVVAMPTKSSKAFHAATRLHWQRLAAHIAAGFRLNRKLFESGSRDPTAGADAVLESSGEVAHATGDATPRSSRQALREAVLATDRARGSLRRRAPEEALEVWRGLVAGRWTLLDHFDRDGRRYVIAHRNDPDAPDPRALTLRERQVVGYAALGQSNKLIAYELGVSESTVGVLLHKAAAKLGARSRGELGIFAFPPRPSDAPQDDGSR